MGAGVGGAEPAGQDMLDAQGAAKERMRMRLLFESATSAKVPLASIATPSGKSNEALIPVPSAKLCEEPASVDTVPENKGNGVQV